MNGEPMSELVIRAVQPDDIPALAALLNLPGVRSGTLEMPYPTDSAVRARFLSPPAGKLDLVAVREGTLVGWGFLHRRSGRQAHVAEIGVAIHDDAWGRGHGRALFAALLDVADNWMGLMRVYLEVDTENTRAIEIYKSYGFVIEGTYVADTVTAGVLVDSHVMARLRDVPPRRSRAEAPR